MMRRSLQMLLACSALVLGCAAIYWRTVVADGMPAPVTAPAATLATAPPATSPATTASTSPTTTETAAALSAMNGDWPAFHGGGELRGEAKAIGDKPLAVRWKFKPEADAGAIEASAAIVGQYVYVGDSKGRLYCLALADGKPKWTYTTESGFSSPPLVVGGRIYVGDMDGIFHCLSADKGEKIWTYDAGNGQPIHAGANAAGDRVIYGDDGAAIICLTMDGKKAWQFAAGDRVNGAPAIGNGMAFVSGCDAKLRGLDLATGKEKFAFDLDSLAPGSPAFAGDRMVIGLDGGHVLCVTADGSKAIWTYEDVKDAAMVYASPAIADGVVVAGARDRQVHAIDLKTGKSVWKFEGRGDFDSSPAIAGGRVYIGCRDKKLYVLDLKTGKSLDEFQATRGIEASPAIGQGVVVIGDSGGAVFCLEPK